MIILYILLLHIHVSVRQYICMFENWYSPKMIKVAPVLGQMRLESIGFRSYNTQFFGQTPNSLKLFFCRARLPPLGCVRQFPNNASICPCADYFRQYLIFNHIQPFESVQGNILQGLPPYLQNRTCGFNLSTFFPPTKGNPLNPSIQLALSISFP